MKSIHLKCIRMVAEVSPANSSKPGQILKPHQHAETLLSVNEKMFLWFRSADPMKYEDIAVLWGRKKYFGSSIIDTEM